MWILASSRVSELQVWQRLWAWRQMSFRHVEAGWKPNKKSKKGGAKGSVAILRECVQLGFVAQDSYPRKSILREPGMLGSKNPVKFSKGTWSQIKNRVNKGSVARYYPKVCASWAWSLRAEIRGQITSGNFALRKMRPQSSVGSVEKHLQAQEFGQTLRFIFLVKQRKMSTFIASKRPEEQ